MKGAAIAGLGITEMSRTYTRSAEDLAVDAIAAAIADAGLRKSDIDGLLINRSPLAPPHTLGLGLQRAAGLWDLRLLNILEGEGSSAVQLVQLAAMAVTTGLARTVACVFADTPLSQGTGGGAAFAEGPSLMGVPGFEAAHGAFGWVLPYALAARRHMSVYGTSPDALGTIAVTTRTWASMNERAVKRDPISLDDYRRSPWIVEPFRLLDCSLPVNGGIALIVTTVDHARDLRPPPIHIRGVGQGHGGNPMRAGREPDLQTGAQLAARTAYRMAGIDPSDIDLCEFYDAFTYVTLVSLEDYGFCPKGQGGDFVLSGHLGPSGDLPTNTGGGHLSGYYMQGMTPLSEAVLQCRGTAGSRQVPDHDLALVTGQGGVLDYHACLILSPHE